MTQPKMPMAADPDRQPPIKAGMTLRRKVALLAIPTTLALVSVPVGIAQAHGVASGHVAAAATAHLFKSAAAKAVQVVASKPATKAALASKTAGESAEAADGASDPAETGADTGHMDETPGSTTESNVDHQFNGQE